MASSISTDIHNIPACIKNELCSRKKKPLSITFTGYAILHENAHLL